MGTGPEAVCAPAHSSPLHHTASHTARQPPSFIHWTMRSKKAGACLFIQRTSVYPQCLSRCPAHHRCSMDICWMNNLNNQYKTKEQYSLRKDFTNEKADPYELKPLVQSQWASYTRGSNWTPRSERKPSCFSLPTFPVSCTLQLLFRTPFWKCFLSFNSYTSLKLVFVFI